MNTDKQRERANGWLGWPVARLSVTVLLLSMIVASFLPLIETNVWWVRFLDFPIVQLTAALLLLIAVLMLLGGLRQPWSVVSLVVGIVALCYQAYRLYPYTTLVAPMALAVSNCPEGDRLDLLVANVQQSNEHSEELFRIVEEIDPDVLILLETDSWWNEALANLADQYPYGTQYVPEGEDTGAFGMHLLSRGRLIASETGFYFGKDTPTIVAELSFPKGALVQIVAVHPRPPHYWSQPTTMRDAHLLTAALVARNSDIPTVVAGDLNAAPWDRMVRRALRIGELLDPRVGRGIYPTYDVQNWLMSWPLDQVLFQNSIGLAAWEVLPPFGSDHAAILAGLCLAPGLAALQSAPKLEAGDIEEADTSIQAARTMAQ